MSKSITCCFTGHRPKSLPWGYEEKGISCRKFKNKLSQEIRNAIKNGYEYFISGMALGIDIVVAELVIDLRKKHPNIKLECVIPCLNQTIKWQEDSKERYENILNNADKITYVSNTSYFNGCMQKRNLYMVDNSSLLIAVFNGANGGTKSTIELARKKGLNIKIIKP